MLIKNKRNSDFVLNWIQKPKCEKMLKSSSLIKIIYLYSVYVICCFIIGDNDSYIWWWDELGLSWVKVTRVGGMSLTILLKYTDSFWNTLQALGFKLCQPVRLEHAYDLAVKLRCYFWARINKFKSVSLLLLSRLAPCSLHTLSATQSEGRATWTPDSGAPALPSGLTRRGGADNG